MELLGRLPEQNEFVRTERFDITVQMLDEQRIDNLIIRVKTDKEETQDA